MQSNDDQLNKTILYTNGKNRAGVAVQHSKTKKKIENWVQKIESGNQQYEVMNPSSVDSFVAYNRSY